MSRQGIVAVRGFTLLELIVVIFTVSMLIAVILPSFPVLKEQRLRTDAGRVASMLRYLNDNAISTKQVCEMRINIKQGILNIKGPDGEKIEKITGLTGITLQSKGRVSDGEVIIPFSPTGGGEHFTIHLASSEASLDIVFNALSGRVKVTEYEKV
jgi:general secretion pathway protein H